MSELSQEEMKVFKDWQQRTYPDIDGKDIAFLLDAWTACSLWKRGQETTHKTPRKRYILSVKRLSDGKIFYSSDPHEDHKGDS